MIYLLSVPGSVHLKFHPEVDELLCLFLTNSTLKVCSRRGFPDLSMRLSCRSVSLPSLRLSDLCQIVSWCIGSRFTRGGPWPLFRGGGWWTGRCNGRLSCTSSRWLIFNCPALPAEG